MGKLRLKPFLLLTVLIVGTYSQPGRKSGRKDFAMVSESKPEAERDNSWVVINPSDCSDDANSSFDCTKIREMLSTELQETNHQLQELKTAASDQQGSIPSCLKDVNRQLEQLQIAMSNITELLTKSPALTTQQAHIATTRPSPMPTTHVTIDEDCTEVLARGNNESGVYTVQPADDGMPVQVYCDMKTDGGGWTVFQRRQDGSVDFFRNFKDYSQGFGDLDGEFWLGNDILHRFIAQNSYRIAYVLRIDMTDLQGESAYAVYDTFSIGPSYDYYRLNVRDYSGTAGDSLNYHNDQEFSTWDRDRDDSYFTNCAEDKQGAWWFKSCFNSHLNGKYIHGVDKTSQGIIWAAWKGNDSLKKTEMKIRRKY